MNFAIFKLCLKKNLTLISMILSVMVFYALIIINMYDPSNMDAITAMYEMLPAEMINAFGFSADSASLTGFLSSWLYGFIMTVFPLVYSIVVATGLVSKTVDNGSIACLLATPIKREKIIYTKLKFGTISLFFIHLISFLVIWIACEIIFPNSLEIKPFALLNISVTMLNVCAFLICFLCSCIFSDNKKAVTASCVITIGSFVLNMLGNVSEKSEFLKSFSIYGAFKPEEIAAGADVLVLNLVYFAIIMVMGIASIYIFKNKNLYI